MRQQQRTAEITAVEIHLLQNELRNHGLAISTDEIQQTFFGDETRASIKKFQQMFGLKPTGKVNGRTANLMISMTSGFTLSPGQPQNRN